MRGRSIWSAQSEQLRPPTERAAQRTGYRPGQVLQLDWLELPTRPRIAGRERRVYALLGTLPYSGAQSAHFTFDMTCESFLEGHAALFDWLGGVPRECVYDNLRSVVAKRERDVVHWNRRFLHLRGHYAFHATACTPATPREKGSVEGGVRHLKTGSGRRGGSLRSPISTSNTRTGAIGSATARIRPAASWSHERLAEERDALRALPPARFDYAYARESRVPLDGYLRYRQSFYRAPEALVHQRVGCTPTATRSGSSTAARRSPATRAATSPAAGCRHPVAARAAARAGAGAIVVPEVCPPELADYAELCA